MATTKDNTTKVIKRDLPVKLQDVELAGVAREIGRLNKERQTMEAQAKVSAAQWKDRIGGIEATIADLATKANDGTEPRPVDCEEQYDYRRGEVRVVRKDTGEQLEVRPMTNDERQPSLPIDRTAGGTAPAQAKNDTAPAAAAPATTTKHAADPDAPPGDAKPKPDKPKADG